MTYLLHDDIASEQILIKLFLTGFCDATFNNMMHLDKKTYHCLSGFQMLVYWFGQPNYMPKLK